MRSTKTSCQTPSRNPIAASLGNRIVPALRSRGVLETTGSSRRSRPSSTFERVTSATAMSPYLRAEDVGDAMDDIGGGELIAARGPVTIDREFFEHAPGTRA